MATYTGFDLPPTVCERCGYSTFDGYCEGEITFDDGDRVAVCYGCYMDWESIAEEEPDENGEPVVTAAAAAGFQRRGVENYRKRMERELQEMRERRAASQRPGVESYWERSLRESRERRAAAAEE